MLAGQVNDEFPIEQDVTLPTTRKAWRNVGIGWVSYQRPYPGPHSKKPLKNRMQALTTCTMCHAMPVLQYDHYGNRPRLEERLCEDCFGTYVRSGYTSEYQNRIDDSVSQVVGYQEYQEERRNEPTGQQRLAAAIIASCAADLWRKTRYHGKNIERLDARKWLAGGKARMTFHDCCALLNLDEDYVRQMVFASKEHFKTGHESARSHAGMYHPAVGEDVPDVSDSERSKPVRRRVVKQKDETQLAIAAIAIYTS